MSFFFSCILIVAGVALILYDIKSDSSDDDLFYWGLYLAISGAAVLLWDLLKWRFME